MRYLRHALALATLAVLPLSIIVAETATTTTPAKKKTTPKKRKSTAKPGSTTASKRTTAARGRTTSYRAPARARQTQPTPERYKEIQQALASKGYLKSEPTGSWNQESSDAMRRFQQDQNINASGKIDSLSLIALGLGPKRGTSATPPAAAPSPDGPKPEAQPPASN